MAKVDLKKSRDMNWKVHTPNLLKEILVNPQVSAMHIPIMILRQLLVQVAGRAIELDDPKLNDLMLRLTLYEQADPESKDFVPGMADGD